MKAYIDNVIYGSRIMAQQRHYAPMYLPDGSRPEEGETGMVPTWQFRFHLGDHARRVNEAIRRALGGHPGLDRVIESDVTAVLCARVQVPEENAPPDDLGLAYSEMLADHESEIAAADQRLAERLVAAYVERDIDYPGISARRSRDA